MSYSIHRSYRGLTYRNIQLSVKLVLINNRLQESYTSHIFLDDYMSVSFCFNSYQTLIYKPASCPLMTLQPQFLSWIHEPYFGRQISSSLQIKVISRFARTYVGHDSGADIYVPACCLCVCMLLHTGAMRRIYEGHASFWPAASAASKFPSAISHRKRLIVKKLIVVKTKKMTLLFFRKKYFLPFPFILTVPQLVPSDD